MDVLGSGVLSLLRVIPLDLGNGNLGRLPQARVLVLQERPEDLEGRRIGDGAHGLSRLFTIHRNAPRFSDGQKEQGERGRENEPRAGPSGALRYPPTRAARWEEPSYP